ncbi:MAG TPA: DUF4397 domain-containing protein [Microcella sp.]|nr:DUF4397 domain-containing protein [Microcella sp.]
MRNRILAGVGVAALATLGLATPANATAAETSDIYVVHGIPGPTVDVYVGEDLTLEDFEPSDVAGPLQLPAGDYDIQVYAADAEFGVDEPVIDATGENAVTVPEAGLSISLVAHLDAEGAPALSPFVNDVTETAAGEGRLTVRHAAAAPAVDVFINDARSEFVGVTNGQQGSTDVPVDTYSAFVAAAGTQEPAIGPADVNITEGVNTIVYAVGSLADETATFYIQTIEVGAAAVDGIPGGAAGLVAENNTGALVGGAALLIALLAAAGIIARRATVSSK